MIHDDAPEEEGTVTMSRSACYLLVNLGLALLVAAASVLNAQHDVHPVYVLLLFALCTSPLLHWRRLNDRYLLLVAFCATFFLFYGSLDCLNLLWPQAQAGSDGADAGSSVLSPAELVILAGGVVALLGYHAASHLTRRRRAGKPARLPPADWSEGALIGGGILLWATCTWLSWKFTVTILEAATASATARGIAKLGPFTASVYVLANMLQSAGVVCIAYAYCRYRRKWLALLVIGVVLIQLMIGFVEDIKGNAIIGIVLVLLVKALIDGKIPKAWLVTALAGIALIYPVLVANRAVRDETGIDRSQAAHHLWATVKEAMAINHQEEKTQSDGPPVFLERMSLKGSVELIVSETGTDVPFQRGYTLTPLLTIFIPRFIWPDKPDVQTGQVMNREFHVSPVAFTYVSPSHLGELYWNFGWPGVIFGMLAIGALLGVVGTRFELMEHATLTRILILAATVQQLILGAEGSIAVHYSEWARLMVAIGLMHALFARRVAVSAAATPLPSGDLQPASQTTDQETWPQSPFPNLMR